jgi:hypothetical protein
MSYKGLMGIDPARGELVEVSAIVDQPSRDMLRIRHAPTADIAVIQSETGLEVLIAVADSPYDSYRLKVEPAKLGQELVLSRADPCTFLIEYRDVR